MIERIRSRRLKTRPPATPATHRPEPVVAEVATDFYVIPYSEPVRADESMRVVRTDVPRSSLAAFGLPVNDERAFDPIPADVLVGEDNVARAIRFVREWRLPSPAKRLHAQQEP